MNINTIHTGDCLQWLRSLPPECVDCCVTSPPYFGLRDYGTAKWEGGDENCKHIMAEIRTRGSLAEWSEKNAAGGGHAVPTELQYKNMCSKCGARRVDSQIGLEETPELFVSKMVEVFTEVKRVLKKEGTLWLNLGDSYWGSGKAGYTEEYKSRHTEFGHPSDEMSRFGRPTTSKHDELKPKDLIGIPWLVAFALRSSGWYLRQDIIWHKPNPMPESVTDRCTKAHEYIFLLSKSQKYYYDAEAIKQPIADASVQKLLQDVENQKGSERVPGKTNGSMKAVIKGYNHRGTADKKLTGHSGNFDAEGNLIGDGKANKRSVWTVTTKPFSEAHFATFPEDLIVDCIKAGCPENGIVLDPFMGAGTTALVARKLNRNCIGCELNPEYVKIANKRLQKELGFFL